MIDKTKLNKIWQAYSVGILVYVVLIVLALIFMNHSSFSLITSFWTSNDLASHVGTVFAYASNSLISVEYRYLLTAVLALSVIVPAIYIYLIKTNKKKIDLHKLRWIDWTATSTLIIITLALLSSLQDTMTVVMIAGLYILGCALLWIATHQFSLNKSIYNKSLLLGIISIVLPWVLVIFYACSTWVYGSVRSPWSTYALYLVGIINTAIIIYGPFWHQNRIGKEKELSTELNPIIVNQVIKVAFSVVLIVGLR